MAVQGVEVNIAVVVAAAAVRTAVADRRRVCQRAAAGSSGDEALLFLKSGQQDLGVEVIGLRCVVHHFAGGCIAAEREAAAGGVAGWVGRAEAVAAADAAAGETVEKCIYLRRRHGCGIVEN